MIGDFDQPAKHWIADAIENVGEKLKRGEDASLPIQINGAWFEFRLIELPGGYEPEAYEELQDELERLRSTTDHPEQDQ